MPCNITHEVVLLARGAAQNLPQSSGLDEILVRDGDLLRDGGAGPFLVFLGGLDGFVGQVAVRGWVVRVGAVVAVDGHEAVPLVGVEGAKGPVDGDLLVVDPQPMAVGVRVRKETGLEDRIGAGLDAGHQMGWGKGQLLDLGEVVVCVTVEGEFAEGAKTHFALRPNFREVEDVPAEFLGVIGAEDLDVAGPGRVVSSFDCVKQVLRIPVGVLRSHLRSFLVVECLVTLVGLHVYLDIIKGAIRFGELVGMARVSIHVTIGVRGPSIGEEMHDLVSGFLVGRKVIPEHGGILKVGLRVTLLGMDEEGELGRITEEEDWGVVEDPVPIPFLCVEFDGETSWVASSIW